MNENYNPTLIPNELASAVKEGCVTRTNWIKDNIQNKTQEEINLEIQSLLSDKQDSLIDGVNVKTINGESVLGEGDLVIDSNTVYESQFNDGTKTSHTIGNIPQGTDISTLRGQTITEILDKALFSDIWPSDKTHTITFSGIPTIVEENSTIIWPSITAIWNSSVTPDPGNQGNITYSDKMITPTSEEITRLENSTYNVSGIWTWQMTYSHPSGTYIQTSSLGNDRTKTIDAINNGIKSQSFNVTRAVFIKSGNSDFQKQTLFPINVQTIINKNLTGSPIIKIPWATSNVKVEADLGFGYMEVNGWSTSIDDNYIILQKLDSYSQSVPHRITITLIKN